MTENKNDGWGEEKVYTVLRNKTKNSKIVLSQLRGIEIAPGQTLDLRTSFRKSEVQDAAHEIASLIRTGHLEDLGGGPGGAPAIGSGMPTKEELQKKMTESMVREINDSSNLSFLEDQMNSKVPEVAQAARQRAQTLLGIRDDQGNVIPGREEESEAEPTKLIRGEMGQDAESAAPGAGVVHRAA